MNDKYVSTGTVEVNGEAIPYTATAESFTFTSASGAPEASMFTFSYERTNMSDTTGRPVLFGWNGGPGAASMFVHMGLLSPQRLKCGSGTGMPYTAPVSLANNDNCLLDVCDVVAIDAVGTGYARLYDSSATAKYCSTQYDAEMFALVIRRWLSRHDRWNSPVYIMGESYGTVRTALVADALFYSREAVSSGAPLVLDGIINLGSAVNYAQDKFPVPDAVLNLPSIAVAKSYWEDGEEHDPKAVYEECLRFCYEEYLPALAKGRSLPEKAQRKIAAKLARYTGYSVEKLLEDRLDVPVFDYPVTGMKERDLSVGIYDSRFALSGYHFKTAYDYFADEASNSQIYGAFSIAYNGLWKKQLGIETEEDYVTVWNTAEANWNFKTQEPAVTKLEKAMRRNPKMKLMFGMGYYDMLTTPGWVNYFVNHSSFDPDRLYLNYYRAGHMPYVSDEEAYRLESDIKAFIRA